jgi:hypothetical protein
MKTIPEIIKVSAWQDSTQEITVRIEDETRREVIGTFYFTVSPEWNGERKGPVVVRIARSASDHELKREFRFSLN